VGPDGALWFTEGSGNKIGQVTTGGNVSEVAIPTLNSLPFGIVTGADGHLWFTEFSGNKIGEMIIV
jgi:virginiamycin B lyase